MSAVVFIPGPAPGSDILPACWALKWARDLRSDVLCHPQLCCSHSRCRTLELEGFGDQLARSSEETRELKGPTDQKALQVFLMGGQACGQQSCFSLLPTQLGRSEVLQAAGGQAVALIWSLEPPGLSFPTGAPCSHEATWEIQWGYFMSFEAFFGCTHDIQNDGPGITAVA